MSRKCRVQRSVTVKASERWLLTTTCGQWTSLRHTLYTHHVLDTAPVQVPPPFTLTHHMHTLLEASQSMCANACVSVCVFTSQMHSCLSGCYRLFSVPRAPLATSDGFSPPSFPFSPCQLVLVSRVPPFTAAITENPREDVQPRGGRWKQQTAFQPSRTESIPSCHFKKKKRAFTSPGQKAAFTPSAAGASL